MASFPRRIASLISVDICTLSGPEIATVLCHQTADDAILQLRCLASSGSSLDDAMASRRRRSGHPARAGFVTWPPGALRSVSRAAAGADAGTGQCKRVVARTCGAGGWCWCDDRGQLQPVVSVCSCR